MIVVDGEAICSLPFADGAYAILSRQEAVILTRTKAVGLHDPTGVPGGTLTALSARGAGISPRGCEEALSAVLQALPALAVSGLSRHRHPLT